MSDYQVEDIVGLTAEILSSVGIPKTDALTVAGALVEADQEGVASHGLLMLPMYVERIQSGSVSPKGKGEIVSDHEAVIVIDGGHCLGHVIADWAMDLAIGKARTYGAGIAAVRAGFHFGTARRYSTAAARKGCIGIVMCNTRPLMPAVGGAERLVGTNPLSIAIPTSSGPPLALDISFAVAAMGKIRLAAQTDETIPPTWATDSEGVPTTDPHRAIEGMLLPVGEHKGFGMAMMVDLLSSLLSGGASGSQVQPLFGDLSVPYDCSQLLMAIDVGHAHDPEQFLTDADAAVQRVRQSERAPGVDRIYTPGEPEWERRVAAGKTVALDPAVVAELCDTAVDVGVDPHKWIGDTKTGEVG
jgi:LDH2 family malate/lactate/ureidoglycolate dehydrogenase